MGALFEGIKKLASILAFILFFVIVMFALNRLSILAKGLVGPIS